MESQSQPGIFSVRIVSIDYYTAPPIPGFDISYSSFHGGRVNEVPVIRIYGSTPAGQKTCLHVHQILPYLYIPCSDLGNITNDEVESCTHSISLALEKALQLKVNVGAKRQHVHGCDLVRARKFYGYHSSEELFVKIYFYYPQDVSRAANLLLTGAILDRILQPYESHIPFLLQFLIDYNLYGMSHLHLLKLKFRCPVPEVSSHRKVVYNQRATTNDPNSGGDSCLNTPLWVSSTIPDEWIWQCFSQSDSSIVEDIPLLRHQSTSELEADAAVHDIINQQFVSFTPLSQTHSDVKMIQSLIPIWEEEYKRNGVPEAVPANSQKPFPQDVLKILSDGVGLENFVGMQNVSDIWLIKSSPDSGDLADSRIDDLDNSNHPSSKYLKASNQKGSLSLLTSPSVDVEAADVKEVEATDKLQISGTPEPPCAQDADEDALRLLNWFASSQAAEDINSDDELVRETILSPFLPSKEIDKVLERANVDYDSESQKECQDILDSIDMIDFEESEVRAYNTAECSSPVKVPLNETIPQLDGSSDDLLATSCTCEAPKPDIDEVKSRLEVGACSDSDSDLICNHRNKRPRWCSLPISWQKVSDVVHPNRLSTSGGCDNKGNEVLGTLFGNEAERTPLVKVVPSEKDVNYTEQGCAIVECSTRDLMRIKRSHRVEPSHNRNLTEDWKAESGTDAKCGERQIRIDSQNFLPSSSCDIIESENLPDYMNLKCSVQLDYGNYVYSHLDSDTNPQVPSSRLEDNPVSASEIAEEYGNRVLQMGDMGSCNVSLNSSLSNLVSKNVSAGESDCKTSISMGKFLNIPTEDSKGIGSINFVQYGCSPYQGDLGLSSPCDTSEKLNEEAETTKLIGMTFSKKPPTIDWTDELDTGTPVLLQNAVSNVGTSLLGSSVDDCLPLFVSKCGLGGWSPLTCKYVDSHEQVMGVPIIYQNDGSYLFMLTPAISPPSKESVDKWLSSNCSSALSTKINAPSPFHSRFKGFSGDMMESQDCQSENSNCHFPESASLTDEISNLDQQPDHNQLNHGPKVGVSDEIQIEVSTSCTQDASQISGPDMKIRLTPLSQLGFMDPASIGQGQQLTLLSIELQAESRGDLRPDPRFDAVNVIVLVFQEDDEVKLDVHVLVRSDSVHVNKDIDVVPDSKVLYFTEELHLFDHFTRVIHAFDPDVLMGWDVQSGSIGFLAERAAHLGIGLLNSISRTPSQINLVSSDSRANGKELIKESFSESVAADAACLENAIIEDEWGRTHASGVHVAGRIVLNIWRLMRNEVKLNMYTVEAVAEAVLRRKIPYIPWKVLSRWFSSVRARYRSLIYTLDRAKLNLQIMNQLDMINRTSELARVFGIDFFSVLSRGSQYRVESMFLRLAHTQNYLGISPGNQQVASQPAMECLPLVMEPESRFYADPVIVLDFQSLYPSMVIAYNLCFCTCLGKVTPAKANTLGVSSYSLGVNILRNVKHELLFTPNGVVYVPSKVRKGILPKLLEEILSTRIMVKQTMKKLAPSEQVRHRILNARQLALKLIANVTYGYTAAGFSGRMPCAELADSIVQCGRRTLETAISFVNSNDRWKARVIYGDTDSMFVLLKGRSLKEAFAVGREIASAISEMNPDPVTLKMEKVYYPCFLLTKKRYVGYSYESPDQRNPIFDAKGIETVRRDTCSAVSKTMERSLRIFFESQDIDKVKAYMLRQWTRILSGRVTLKDFVFAKEVRLGTYSARAWSLPPAAIVATKSMRADPRAEPRYAERIPYVVVHGEPGARLVDMVVDPLELLALDSPFRLNDIYYITKQIIPALQRVFGLVGADLNQWFLDMPRPGRETLAKRHSLLPNPLRTRIDFYYASKHCILCGELVRGSAHVCPNCSKDKSTVALALTGRTSKLEKDIQCLTAICRHCGGGDWLVESGVKCTSLACSVFYERRKVQKELLVLSHVAATAGFYPTAMVEWF